MVSQLSKLVMLFATCATSGIFAHAQVAFDGSAQFSTDASVNMSVGQPVLPGYVDLTNLPSSGGGGRGNNRQTAMRLVTPSASHPSPSTAHRVVAVQANRHMQSDPGTGYWKPVPYAPTSLASSFSSGSNAKATDSLGLAGSFGSGSFGAGEAGEGMSAGTRAFSPSPPASPGRKAASKVSAPSSGGGSNRDSAGSGSRSNRGGAPAAARTGGNTPLLSP